MEVVLGFKAHSGWAALVALGADGRKPVLADRRRVELVDTTWGRAPYHAAEARDPASADALVKRGIAAARRVAAREVAAAVQRMRVQRHDVVGCAVLMPAPMPPWSTAEILAVHFRMHKAEGVLFPDALCRGAEASAVPICAVDEKTIDDRARRARVDPGALDALGKAAGPPWGKDQKLAALAAGIALAERTPR